MKDFDVSVITTDGRKMVLVHAKDAVSALYTALGAIVRDWPKESLEKVQSMSVRPPLRRGIIVK